MSFQDMEFHITGISPTVMHNGQLADPLNKFTKALRAVTSKMKKTDDDHAEMARLEFLGGLYVDASGAPCWPGECIEAMFKAAAKMSKCGKSVERGLWVDGNWPLIYRGPKTADALWEDGNFRFTCRVKLSGKTTIMRTRPIFHEWSLKFAVKFDVECLSPDRVKEFAVTAGRYIGLSDFRPRYGRFDVL